MRSLLSLCALCASIVFALPVMAQEASDAPMITFHRTLTGEVAGQPVHMHLRRAGDALDGSYAYDRIGSDIPVEGSVAADGAVVLREYDAAYVETATFTGRLDGFHLGGTWRARKGGPVRRFTLREAVTPLPGGASLGAGDHFEGSPGDGYTIYAEFPTVVETGPDSLATARAQGFAQAAKDLVQLDIAYFKDRMLGGMHGERAADEYHAYEAWHRPPHVGNGLVSIEYFVSTYLAGAAHPHSHSLTLSWDVDAGRAVALNELFRPGAPYLQVISAWAIRALTAALTAAGGDEPDGEWIAAGAAPEADLYTSWVVAPEGLTVLFNPYRVASYAAGPQRVTIPWSVLADYLVPGGLVAAPSR